MRYEITKSSKEDKTVYKFIVGEEELEILARLTHQAFSHTPRVFEISAYRARLKNIAKVFCKVWIEEVKGKKLPTYHTGGFHNRIRKFFNKKIT